MKGQETLCRTALNMHTNVVDAASVLALTRKVKLTSESRASGPCRVDVDNHGNGRTQRPLLSRMPDSTAVTCAYVRSYLARMYCIEVWIPRRTCRRCLLPLLVALRVGMPVMA